MLRMIIWNIEGFRRNKYDLLHFVQNHDFPDFIHLCEPQMFQCDLALEFQQFRGHYYCSLNSPDIYDPDLPLRSSRCVGGTMIMWKKEHDPYVTIPSVSSSSYLSLIFAPPDLQPTIHIVVYLPTSGRESEFVEEMANLDSCITALIDDNPGASVFIRGDFNVNSNHTTRIGLLEYFCKNNALQSVDIPHPTYHHFVGNGLYDSHLDKIFFSSDTQCLEQLSHLHCKLDHPLIGSHHDMLVSVLHVPKQDSLVLPNQNLISAPRVPNKRTKIIWSESGIADYQRMLAPLLQLIQDVWLTSPAPSSSVMSLCLQSTTRVLTDSALATNKGINLDEMAEPKSAAVSRKVKLSQQSLLRKYKAVGKFSGTQDILATMHSALNVEKAKHRALLRSESATVSVRRDKNFHSILNQNSSQVFKSLRSLSRNKARKISKLSVNGKLYSGETVPDGFYDSLHQLKTLDHDNIQDQATFERCKSDYSHILEICKSGAKIPSISLATSTRILKKIRPAVSDYYSVTALHFLNAGEAGIYHFFLLLKNLISDINNISIEEVNTVHAVILFKGHNKDRSSASSYRTISTCPLVAKALDIFVQDLNIDSWNMEQASTQFLGSGSSHELAALVLSEVIHHSNSVLDKPVFILYLDAKSAFDKVLRQLLIRNLFFCGTQGEELLYIDKRLKHRKTFVEWDKNVMGPILDELGVEQGGVSSGDYYKIYAKSQLQLAQDSGLGVRLTNRTTISAIGQADDTVLVANNPHSLQNLLDLSLHYCRRFNVELCPGKTILQVITPKKHDKEVKYLKEFAPIVLNQVKLQYKNTAVHVGIIRATTGNLPNILDRIVAHKRAVAAVLHIGAARNHRGNPIAGLKLERVYGFPVLMSGLGALILKKSELAAINKHHKLTINNLLRLPTRTPQSVCYFLAGSLPGEALVHLRQLSLLGMISDLPGTTIHNIAVDSFSVKSTSSSWFYQVRETCLQYQLPHPLELLTVPPPYTKDAFKSLAKKNVLNYWEIKLRKEASDLSSLKYFQPQFMSLSKPHPIFMSAGSSPYEVVKAGVQATILSGRYKTERLCRHWSENKEGFCILPSCLGKQLLEDERHILLDCGSLVSTRIRLSQFTINHTKKFPVIKDILLNFTNPENPRYCQFLIDCSSIPEVITLSQKYGHSILNQLFKVTRTWCYSLHRERLKVLGRWHS